MTQRATSLTADEARELIPMLAAAGLPNEDLTEEGRTFFRIEDEAGLIGYGGLEGRGSDRLLRSLVVSPERQRQGLGRVAVSLIEEQARQAGTDRLHLLTTTATSFFQSSGYQEAARSDAPTSIRSSKEFSSLCPSTATYMVKQLSG